MSMYAHLIPFGSALLGALFQEFLKIYSVYESGSADDIGRMKRLGYIIITTIVIVGSAVGSVVWNLGNTVGARDYLVLGAAFPLIFKAAVNAAVRQQERTELGSPSFGDLLRLYVR
jgi:hypothetical protein